MIVLRIEFDFILDPSVPCIKQLVVATHAVGFSNAYVWGGGGDPHSVSYSTRVCNADRPK